MAVPAAMPRQRPARSTRGWIVMVAGGVGLVLLVYLIARLGPARIAAELVRLGSVLPAIMAIAFAKYCLQAAGWRLVLPEPARPGWVESVGATITGDALGYLTWAGPFTGEPVRALLIRRSVPVALSTAAGAVERAMYNATAAGLVLIVLVGGAGWRWLAATIAAGALTGALFAQWVAHRRRSSAARCPNDTAGGASDLPVGKVGRGLATFRATARQLWTDRRGVLPALAAMCVAQHALLVVEAWVMLSVLTGGAPSLRTALVFEAVTKIVNTVGLVVPARIGVSEGGSALLAGALGFAASQGLSLALMRRARALIWAGVGLALLPIYEARTRRTP